ncbi:MAG: hypothetical protein AVDCRST_MAG93-6914 [uncultured Chloroflexia bacterium]|uniref:Uncharacterized protein n=1 Tax=uncultured Chloroflexia bacterium TaxID=1672391 RepID=A0A6J4M1R5_9CHLR|nr:MAG: hypothetical protein AVDCRST_MAG93-6914 [uncultured Chloroflexia bacterium]
MTTLRCAAWQRPPASAAGSSRPRSRHVTAEIHADAMTRDHCPIPIELDEL